MVLMLMVEEPERLSGQKRDGRGQRRSKNP